MKDTEGGDRAMFAAAQIQLYGRLWWALEQICRRLRDERPEADLDVELGIEIFRLELAILLDVCESRRWRWLLPADQRRGLREILRNVAATLAVWPDELDTAIVAAAQNLLFDAVVDHCTACAPKVRSEPRQQTPRALVFS